MNENRGTTRRTVLRAAALGGPAVLSIPFVRRANAAVSLNFWDMIWGPQQYIDAARGLVERFNRENPTINVSYRSVPWANWYQTFVTAISSGTAPDISTGAGYQAVQLYDADAILPIDDVIAELRADGQADDFLPGTIDTLRYDNHYVALPWGLDMRVWYYRKDHFAAASRPVPANWAELRDAAKVLTTHDHAGIVGSGDTGGSHYLYSLINNNDGGFFTTDRKLDIDNSRNREAFQFLADMVHDGSFAPASAGYDSIDRRKAFLQGQASTILDTPGLVDQGPDVADRIGVMPPLAGPHGDKGTVAWNNNIMLYRQTKNPAETKLFLKWWSVNAKPLWTEGKANPMPARKSIAADPYFTGNPVRSYIIANYIPISKTTGTHAPGIFPKLNELEGEGVMQTLIQDILQGKDLDGAIGRARTRLRDIMAS